MYVHQTLLQREGIHVVVELGVGQRLVDVIELNTQRGIVLIYRLQTGDVDQEGGSRQASKHQDGIVLACYVADIDRFAIPVDYCDVG
jgi:hypothetical protein